MTTLSTRDGLWPDPPELPENAAFLDAARNGRFLIRKCSACGEAHWYPRVLCPFCMSETDWHEASGEGEILSYTVLGREDVVRAVAYVTLKEGPSMMTELVDLDPTDLHIGLPVRVRFVRSVSGHPVPVFGSV